MNTVIFIGLLASAATIALAKPSSFEVEDNVDYDYLNELINGARSNIGKFTGSGRVRNVEDLETLGFNVDDIPAEIKNGAFISVPQLIMEHGYQPEVHHIQTEDGYNLEMHRIIGGPPSSTAAPTKRQPVFLMHGLLASSSCWILTGPERGLAYMLFDLGYDVWMGNARGNVFSRSHVSLDPDGPRTERRNFWDFSWHEIGVIDVPTMIDYILKETDYAKLHYIGHSQGTTSFFVMASELPAYNDKILSMNALAPVAYMSNLRDPVVRSAVAMLDTIVNARNLIGMYEFPTTNLFHQTATDTCLKESEIKSICSNFYFLIGGYNSKQFDPLQIPAILGHFPVPASSNQLIHYGQEVRSGHFRQFDFGTLGNLLRYRSINPPDYKIKNIRAPVALHYANSDTLVEPIDVFKFHIQLPNSLGMINVPDPQFTHLDFILSVNVKSLLYEKIFKIMKSFE